MTNNTTSDIELIAAQERQIPRFTDPLDTLLYFAFRGLYAEFRASAITHENAKIDKRKILTAYATIKTDRESMRTITKRTAAALNALPPSHPVAKILDGR